MVVFGSGHNMKASWYWTTSEQETLDCFMLEHDCLLLAH